MNASKSLPQPVSGTQAPETTTSRSGSSEPCCTLAIDGTDQERLVEMFKALGNPIRFEIMKFLVTHPGCITAEIVDHLPIAQATVSQHLRVLRDAGWIEGSAEGTATCYELDAWRVAWFRRWIDEIF
jgi:DNA-binding transcriptional ArsR family regulator